MTRPRFDGIIEAAKYKVDGNIDWVRAYLRRGPTFSDTVMLDRNMLIDQLLSGKRFMTGSRIELRASTFEVGKPVKVVKNENNGNHVLVVGDNQATDRDQLTGVPVI